MNPRPSNYNCSIDQCIHLRYHAIDGYSWLHCTHPLLNPPRRPESLPICPKKALGISAMFGNRGTSRSPR